MRELRFRAWHEKLGRMFDDVCVDSNGTELLDDTGKAWWIGHEHIMQFTGLKDKNGKEIYEGDIVKHWYEEAFFQGTVIGVVEYDHIGAAFFIDYPDNGFARSIQSYDLAYSEFEVIGNIYENPDLLNVPSEKGE